MDDLARRVRNARILGLAFLVAGFLAIGLGWNGMARRACPDCQLPYLLSGGAAGLGLIVTGVGLLVLAQMLADRRAIEERIDRIAGVPSPLGAAPSSSEGGNGHRVVMGTSTYHRPECRLVEGKELSEVPEESARRTGLAPCRVCHPEPVAAGDGTR